MVPAAPHSVTIGTGDRRIRPTVVLMGCGQSAIGPSGVRLQSNSAMSRAISPPPSRKPCPVGLPDVAMTVNEALPTACADRLGNKRAEPKEVPYAGPGRARQRPHPARGGADA